MTRLLCLLTLLAAVPLSQAQQMPLSTSSDDARAHYERGLDRLGNADFSGSVAHFDAAIAADPSFAIAHLYRAFADSDGREEHMRHARSGRASDGERQMIEAYAASLDGDNDRQLALLEGLAERYPDDPVLHLWLANMQSGAEAAASARRGIAADPTFVGNYNMLGYAEMRQGNMDAAEEAFLTYIRLAPDEANPYDSYGEFLMEAGRMDEAEAQFERALTRNPDFGNSQMNLARIAMERSDVRFEQAVADADADAIAALYTEDAVVMAHGSPRVRGRDAIRDHFAAALAAGIDGLDIETVNVLVFDDWAVRESNGTLRAGGQVVDRVKTMELWRRVDGEWLYARDMYSSDGEAATAATN